MKLKFRLARQEDVAQMQALWAQAFGDDGEFIQQFFRLAFSFSRCCVAEVEDGLAAMAHWLPCACGDKPLAYLYAVATRADCRGRGYATALLAFAEDTLRLRGVPGLVLVPGSPGLFNFYGKLGFSPCCPQATIEAQAGSKAVALTAANPAQYALTRRTLLPPGGIAQAGICLDFQASLTPLYTGENLVVAADRQPDGTIFAPELLCPQPAEIAPGILRTLGAARGVFRTPDPGGTPFAMFKPLAGWSDPAPAYFGFAFD